MAIKYNGNTIKTIHFNGEKINELMVNGSMVWEKAAGVITGEYENWVLTKEISSYGRTYLHPQQYDITTYGVDISKVGDNYYPVYKDDGSAWTICIPELAGKDYNFEIDLSIGSWGNFATPLRHGAYLQGERTSSGTYEGAMNAVGVVFRSTSTGYRAMPARLTDTNFSTARTYYSLFPKVDDTIKNKGRRLTLRMERRGSTFRYILTHLDSGEILFDLIYTDVPFSNTGDNIIINLNNQQSGARHYDFRLEIL